MAQFRFGILPLRIETGRYTGESIESRLCKYCSARAVETEKHFLLECSFYDDFRNNYFVNDLTNRPENDKLKFMLLDQQRKTAKYIVFY